MGSFTSTENIKRKLLITIVILVFSFSSAFLAIGLGIAGLAVPIALAGALLFLFSLFANPKIGFIFYLVYCFIIAGLLRNLPLPFGPLMEILLGLTWLSILVNYERYDWKKLNNDHCIIALIWFLINVIEVANPAGASILGWLNEIRFTTLNWLMIAPLAFLLFNTNKDLNNFFIIIISISVIAALYGAKQLYLGVTNGEQIWLDNGGAFTHVLYGRLRVFSFYTDAGQFGASQAAISVVAFVLALGPFKMWKKALLLLSAGILFYGMLISGTRGALFALMVAAVFAIFLSKNFKVLIVGSLLAVGFIGFLKYTTLGSGNYLIVRLRTAVDPQDASLNARFINQNKLKSSMDKLPFGAGVGSIGVNGTSFNKGKPLSSVPPDSYWVKIWVMYGVVGLVIWFGMIMYILGKCSGIIWNLRDDGLKIKCIALTSGTAGIFFCSYGNEVMNGFPSSVIMYMSWSFVILAPYLDREILKNKTT